MTVATSRGDLMRARCTAATFVLGVLIAAGSLYAQATPKPAPLDKKSPGYINSKSLPTPWPSTVNEVIMKCERIGPATAAGMVLTLKAPDGKDYAANETATKTKKLPSFEAIWAD